MSYNKIVLRDKITKKTRNRKYSPKKNKKIIVLNLCFLSHFFIANRHYDKYNYPHRIKNIKTFSFFV